MEKIGITKEQAEKMLDEYVKDPITKLHMIESEAIMKTLAKRFGEDEEAWGIVGLLHDIDWDLTKNEVSKHCIETQKILKQAGASDFLVKTIISHGYGMDQIPALKDNRRSTKIEYCLTAAENLTGLIVASALVQPDKKLTSVSPESLKKKFKSKSFAAKCSRELILECEKAGISLNEFLEIGLNTLQKISDKVGL